MSSVPASSSVPSGLLDNVPQSLKTLVENYWADWLDSCEDKGVNAQHEVVDERLGRVWACSDYVAQTCIRYPSVLIELYQQGFELPRQMDDYQRLVEQAVAAAAGASVDLRADEAGLMTALRKLRQQEMLRIAWRDINGLANEESILHELSDFAEAVVSVVLTYLQKQLAEKHGMPCDADGEALPLLVFAMGKMGGRELNFSSDIDLIFSFAEEGETSGRRQTSHSEFYTTVVRKLVKVLDEVTADGFVYRVDTRLRPFGESGPLVMSFSGLEQYYQLQGRDWERYAMIKAKLITGRDSDRQYLLSMLMPFVYRRYLDYGMLESIREMKSMINAQVQRKRMKNNIKLGRGGIREIEFIGQTLQLIRGGREPELRERGIIKVLTLLAEKHYLQQQEADELIAAYWFLRRLENYLQMQRDKQTHVLPDDELSQQRLCLAMQMKDWPTLQAALSHHQNNVDQVFQHLVAHDEDNSGDSISPFTLSWQNADADTSDDIRQYLVSCGYSDVEASLEQLIELKRCPQFKSLTGDSRRRLEKLLASLVLQIAEFPEQQVLLQRVGSILKALVGRKVYISLLTEYPAVQQQMLKLSAASEWFSKRLIRHPILLDGLLAPVEFIHQPYDVSHLLDLELACIEHQAGALEDDLEQQMDRMRQFKRQNIFNVAVLDRFYQEPVEKVSDRLTELADALLQKILQISWQTMVARYGEPGCMVNGEQQRPTMSIIAYGKMGGKELGYSSDLDIIFLHNSAGDRQYTSGKSGSGEKSIDNQRFFARVAQRIIHFLDTRTYSGVLYEADTRLRPDGRSGLMVSSVAAFEQYQHEKAWTWEHQALIRARFVTGDALIEQEFDRIRSSVLRQTRQRSQILQEVVNMRDKMRKHLANRSAGFDIKQDAGGLVDIEFMTQAGVLIHARQCADCISYTATLALIRELTAVGWYQPAEAEKIGHAYRYFRKLKNWQNLQCKADTSALPQHRDNVLAVWHRLMPDVVGDVEKI